jgi:hypothetical protein
MIVAVVRCLWIFTSNFGGGGGGSAVVGSFVEIMVGGLEVEVSEGTAEVEVADVDVDGRLDDACECCCSGCC